MQAWRVDSDAKTGSFVHKLPAGTGHALLAPLIAGTFQALRVSASLCEGRLWWSLNMERDLIDYETAHAVETERWAYNARCFEQARTSRAVVLGKHSGLCDFFVPLLIESGVIGYLVVGPFFDRRPTSANILERWRWLTGRQGHPSDPEFAAYLDRTLATLVVEGKRLRTFERLLGRLAKLMSGEGASDRIANQAHVLRLDLDKTRFAERVWEMAWSMIDERGPCVQYSAATNYALDRMGLSGAPDQVLVGLAVSRDASVDPVEQAVRRDAFQRAAVDLALSVGHVIVGRVGDHGVLLLSDAPGSTEQRKRRLRDLSERLLALGRRRFGLALHFGAALAAETVSLSQSYQLALSAAELALSQDKVFVMSEASTGREIRSLRSMRQELAQVAETTPDSLTALFDRFLEAVGVHSGYRVEPARAEIEICFEKIADACLRSGALDPKGYLAMGATLDRSRSTGSLNGVFAAYRAVVSDLAESIKSPARARQGRGLRGALDYIHQHYGEELSLDTVARVSGFARTYFSELFRQNQGMSFQQYLFKLRIDRAKELLSGTALSVTRIAELTGFHSPQYLCRVFQRSVRQTPLAYRSRVAPHRARKRSKTLARS